MSCLLIVIPRMGIILSFRFQNLKLFNAASTGLPLDFITPVVKANEPLGLHRFLPAEQKCKKY